MLNPFSNRREEGGGDQNLLLPSIYASVYVLVGKNKGKKKVGKHTFVAFLFLKNTREKRAHTHIYIYVYLCL